MTHKTRRSIFYTFLGIFIIVVPIIILYASGLTLDFQKQLVVSTGGIYLKSSPSGANIYIDGNLKGKTSKFIKRLVPKIYEIKVTKEDYHSWEKEFTVQPHLVTKADNIVLLPQNPKISLTTENAIKEFSLLSNKKELFYSASSSFYLFDIVEGKETEILNLDLKTPKFIWSPDNQNVIIISDKQYLMINVSDPKTIIDLLGIIKLKSKSVVSDINNLNFDSSGNKLYFLSHNNLYLLTLNKNSESFVLSDILVPNVINYTIYKNGIIYLEKTKNIINELDVTSLRSARMFDRVYPGFNTGEWLLSDDNKKLLCKKDKSVEILWLEDVSSNSTLQQKGDIDKIDFGQQINDVIWYPKTDEHLIVSTDTSILFAELDNRPPRNIINFITAEKPKIIYNSSNKILYFLSQNKLYQTEL